MPFPPSFILQMAAHTNTEYYFLVFDNNLEGDHDTNFVLIANATLRMQGMELSGVYMLNASDVADNSSQSALVWAQGAVQSAVSNMPSGGE